MALVVKNLNINVGDLRDGGLVHGLERSPVEGNGNPFQHFCLENPGTGEPGGPLSMGSHRVRYD